MDILTIILTAVVGGLLYYLYNRSSHFEELGVLHKKPLPIFGNMAPCLFRQVSMPEHIRDMYNKFSNVKYFGFYDFMTPIVVIRDPELITSIAIKNFDSFVDHRGFFDKTLDPLAGKNLFALNGDHWREMRKLLSPAFTSSKMKQMHTLICDCTENFMDFLISETKGGKDIDTKDIFRRFTNDVVATCAFGISVDSMRNPDNEFYVLGKEAMNFDSSLSLKFLLGKNFSFLMKLFGVRMFSQRVTNFFQSVVESTVKMRDETGTYRPDMIQLMMESRAKGPHDLTIEDMTAQAFVFFIAGFDAAATFMGFLAHVLAVNQDVQERLRAEIEDVLKESEGRPSYETVNRMKYLDAVISETLRMYPLATFLDRVCVKDFELPPAMPGAKPLLLKKGDTVWFSSFSLHHDPQYYPEPSKFDPERFLTGQVDPSVYIPFGIGPRHCIGQRFVLMECKILLFYFLSCCSIERCSKTLEPMVFSKKSFQMMPYNGFWVKLQARDKNCSMRNKLLRSSNHTCEGRIANGI